MRLLNENNLVSDILQGDKSAFSLIFRHYYADMVLFAHTFVKDQAVSEEIAQEAFVKLWENRQTIVITSSLKSFLLKSIQNRCLDHLKHSVIKNRYESSVLQNNCILENDTENYVLYSELQDGLEKAIGQMPEEISSVFRMNRFEGRTYAEIARDLNVSVRTIEVRMGKALTFLRKNLKDYLVTLVILAGLVSA
jgi:RNA polymerase sigma-70 factor, ECF subfamily